MILPSRINFLYTDASERGWGSVLNPGSSNVSSAGTFDEAWVASHITVKELYAVKMALLLHGDVLRGSKLVLFIDNQPGMFMLRNFASKSAPCHALV